MVLVIRPDYNAAYPILAGHPPTRASPMNTSTAIGIHCLCVSTVYLMAAARVDGGTSLAGAAAPQAADAPHTSSAKRALVYIGSYTGGKSRGIYAFHMELGTGR